MKERENEKDFHYSFANYDFEYDYIVETNKELKVFVENRASEIRDHWWVMSCSPLASDLLNNL